MEYIRPRYALPEFEQVEGESAIVQARAPEQVLPKAIAGASLLVQLLVAKYIDHLPLHRQQVDVQAGSRLASSQLYT